MRGGILAAGCALAALLLAAEPHAASFGGNCVYYARYATGISLDGNAGAWWWSAQGRYERGRDPSVGAVLVFKPSGHMRVGHVAVVSRVIGPREILVDQANWIRGRVVKNMSVVDASAANDWTVVKVVELRSGVHGRPNATYGFIYPRKTPPTAGDSVVAADPDAAARLDLPVRSAVAHGHESPGEAAKPAPESTRRDRAKSTVAARSKQPSAKTAAKASGQHAKARRDRAAPAATVKRTSHPDRASPRIESTPRRG